MTFEVKPNFKEVGKVFGPLIKEFQTNLENLSKDDITKLQNNETITMNIGGEDKEITKDMVDSRIDSKEGFNVGMQNNKFVILSTELTRELILEGIAREIVSKVQNLRKTNGYDIADRIKLYYDGEDDILDAFNQFADYIKDETLATVYEQKKNDNVVDINGHDVFITIEKN